MAREIVRDENQQPLLDLAKLDKTQEKRVDEEAIQPEPVFTIRPPRKNRSLNGEKRLLDHLDQSNN
ncbi:MAG TPA: hypothetical protein VF185_02585 [Patescibacteria group bacterium]